jgi:hypothetical protein
VRLHENPAAEAPPAVTRRPSCFFVSEARTPPTGGKGDGHSGRSRWLAQCGKPLIRPQRLMVTGARGLLWGCRARVLQRNAAELSGGIAAPSPDPSSHFPTSGLLEALAVPLDGVPHTSVSATLDQPFPAAALLLPLAVLRSLCSVLPVIFLPLACPLLYPGVDWWMGQSPMPTLSRPSLKA